jgi:thiamine kinase
VSATGEAPAHAVLQRFERGRAALAAGARIAPLSGGVENTSVRVTSAEGEWVLRIAGARDARFAINRVAERQVHAAAAALGFAPAIVYAEESQGVLVTEHLPGAPWTCEELRTPAGLRLIGARLAELHAQPVPRAVRRMNVHDVLAHYLELPDATPGPMTRAELAARLRWSLATYRPAPPALCHNDLHHLNLLGRAPLMFVDWEYAAVGDPVFELAAVVGYHDLDAEQREQLLAAYGRELRRAQVARMCLVFDCLHALWLDAADAWHTLTPERREALLARLAIDPADRRR